MPYVIPTIHPSYVLRQGRAVTDVIAQDLSKAWRVSQEGPDLEETIIHVVPGNPAGLELAFTRALQWMKHWATRGAVLGVDVETSSLDYFNCRLYSIALGDPDSSVAVSFTLKDLHTLPPEYEVALDVALREVLGSPMVTKVYHNSPFDKAVLHSKGYQINGQTLDTQGFAHLIQPDAPKDLGWIGHTYLDVVPWKLAHDSGKMANTNDVVELLVYNAKDALYTAKLVDPMMRTMANRGLPSQLVSWQMAFADLATDMEVYGVPINHEKRRAMGSEKRESMALLHGRMAEFLGWPDFNPMSDAHKREALFGAKYAHPPWNLGITPTKLTKKTQAPSTSYKAIIDFLEHPFVKDLADYIETRATYATQYRDGTLPSLSLTKKGIENPGAYQRAMFQDGRLHAKWNPTGQVGTRFSSSPNIQNQRVSDRAWVEAADGRVVIGADKDQLELRILSCLAGVEELLTEMAREGGDPHILAASHVYGDEFTRASPKRKKTLRTITKNVVYCSIYMGGIETVWRTIRERKQLPSAIRAVMTMGAVRKVHTGFFGRYVEIPRYHENNMRRIKQCGYLEIPPLGRRRYYPVQPPPLTEVANWPTQTTGSDIVAMEMVLIQDELKKRFKGDASCIVHGHDAVYVECAERHAEEALKIVNKIFGSTPLQGPKGQVDLTANGSIGKNLMEVK